ncbi:hypothetical protein Pmani_002234 [Petrolisthes manimaculis]|uniref:CCHC-type domain-containing protein n=1 Tax=Petrolisthes manimaculis TaxID=1843537 RepID=A0AAE1QJ03_9EUCA|nr:hypothetical protein Pmani_002234 [Petrolisthes manimaculis]
MPEQEVVPHSPTTPPGTPRVQAQAVGESHDVILQMLQLFKDECEQKRQEDIRRREAEEQRFNQLVATLGGQTMQQGTSSPVGPIPVSPSTQCRQAEGEKINDFYVRLKPEADEIDLCKADDLGCVETQMKHAMLIGIRDEETKQRLLELPTDTTLDRVLTLCKSREAAENTSHELRPQSVLQPTTCAVSMYKKRKKQAWKPSVSKGSVDYNSGSTQPRVTCDRCGGRPHPKDRCPAVGERCRSCGKVGHYAKRCRSKTVKGVKDPPGLRDRRGNVLCVVSNPRDTGSPYSAIYTTHTRAVGATATSLVGPTSPSINLQVQAGDKSGWVECMPDTGADTTVMGSELLDTLGLTSADLRPSPELGLTEWRKGKLLAVPDALSRAPVDTPSPEDVALSEKACIHVRNVVSHRDASCK